MKSLRFLGLASITLLVLSLGQVAAAPDSPDPAGPGEAKGPPPPTPPPPPPPVGKPHFLSLIHQVRDMVGLTADQKAKLARILLQAGPSIAASLGEIKAGHLELAGSLAAKSVDEPGVDRTLSSMRTAATTVAEAV